MGRRSTTEAGMTRYLLDASVVFAILLGEQATLARLGRLDGGDMPAAGQEDRGDVAAHQPHAEDDGMPAVADTVEQVGKQAMGPVQ